MAISCALLGLSQKIHVIGPLANCHWTELVHDHDRWRLRAHITALTDSAIPMSKPPAFRVTSQLPGTPRPSR